MSAFTPGPWFVGYTVGQHLRRGETTCGYCGKRPLLKISERGPSHEEFSRTVHHHLFETNCRSIVAADGTDVVGMFGYDDGGVCTSADDARLIACAPDFYTEALRLVERHDEAARRCNFQRCGCENCTPFRALIARANGEKV